MARPEKFKPEYVSIILNLAKQGADMDEYALELGVDLSTLYYWAQQSVCDKPEIAAKYCVTFENTENVPFSYILSRAKVWSRAAVKRLVRENLQNPEFNPKTSEIYMKFAHGLSEFSKRKRAKLTVNNLNKELEDGLIDANEHNKLSDSLKKQESSVSALLPKVIDYKTLREKADYIFEQLVCGDISPAAALNLLKTLEYTANLEAMTETKDIIADLKETINNLEKRP